MRMEYDVLGYMEIPDIVYYGIQTRRAIDNFSVSGHTCCEYQEYISALAGIKKAAALANCDIGVLQKDLTDAICTACDEIMNGYLKDNFCIDVFQGGGGTSTNMMTNEIIANRATEILTGTKGYHAVHPNDHVNLGQSTNDVIPSALKIGMHRALIRLKTATTQMTQALRDKQEEFKDIVKIGRTCLQDALPLTLGQEFGGYASMMERQCNALRHVMRQCLPLALGGTSVGTGFGVFDGYHDRVYVHLNEIFGVGFVRHTDLFDALQNADAYLNISGALKSLATSLSKIASDLRLLSSGPVTGLGEICLPVIQPGSSIMPGKVNPVMPELINQIAYQVCGNDFAVTMAAEGGELDLNVWEPVFVKNIFESIKLLTNAQELFREKCVAGIQVNEQRCRENADYSLALATAIGTLYDHESGLMVALKVMEDNIPVSQAAAELGFDEELIKRCTTDLAELCDREKNSKMLSTIHGRRAQDDK